MYLSIELQSFGLYVLSTLYRDSESSTKAGLKYFLLGGLSSCLILLGAGLIYAYTGLTNFESIYSLISVIGSPLFIGPLNILQGLYLGLILIIIGFLFKISAAPLHNWSPDVYDETPTIVTIWLTIMPKISILIFLLELITNLLSYTSVGSLASNVTITESWLHLPTAYSIIVDNNLLILKNLLLVSSLLSLIIGTVVGLAQTRIKRLLAYSTISHIGFILLALLINTEQSIDSLLFYIIQYSITNLNIFLILIALSYIINRSSASDIKYISELKEQFMLNPLLSISLSICLFSMAGIPPLIGFFSKQFVLYSAIQSGYYFISIVAIIVSVISASYYLKIIKVMTSSLSTESYITNQESLEIKSSAPLQSEVPLTNFHSFLISTLTLSILLFILKPSLILNSTQLLSLSLFNF
jgi:NADH-ubiquinone oxidoreductase chain 2